MLISKRRLKWLAMTLLTVCLLLLLRPTRTWIDRRAVAWWFGPHVSVGELIIHPKHSLVEVRNLSWHAEDERRRFQIDIRSGWLGYDQSRLIDRHPQLPKVLLQSANLRLSPATSHFSTAMESWQQQVNQRFSHCNWEHVEQQLDCLEATHALNQLWNVNIDQWIARSQQIMTQAEELERQTERMDNPLRFEILLQEKLTSLQQLASEHASLTQQLDNLSEQIEAASTRLRKLHSQDQIKLTGLIIGSSTKAASAKDQLQLCQQLAQGLGEIFWEQTSYYGEVVDQLLRATRVSERPGYEINVRSNRHGNELFAIKDWRATGNFSYGARTTPFRAAGNWLLTQEPFQRQCLECNWHASFYSQHARIDVRAQLASRQSPTTQWLILQRPPESTAHKRPAVAQLPHQLSQVELTTHAEQIHGQITLSAGSFPWLAWESRQLSNSASVDAFDALKLEELSNRQLHGDPLRFAIDGEWNQAALRLQGAIPDWLQHAVAAAVEQRLEVVAHLNRQRLDREFSNQLSELEKLVTIAVSHSRSLAARHEQQLLATQDRVQRQLAEMNGSEFARGPSTIVR